MHGFLKCFNRQAIIGCFVFCFRGFYAVCIIFYCVSRQDTVSRYMCLLCFGCHVRGPFDCFSRQATVRCYMCVFWLGVFSRLRVLVFTGLADRPTLVALCFVYFSCGWCYVHLFFNCFSGQATISCFMCIFRVLNAMRMLFVD